MTYFDEHRKHTTNFVDIWKCYNKEMVIKLGPERKS